MTTEALISALEAAGLDVNHQNVLDALWLCSLGRILSLGPAPPIVRKLARDSTDDGGDSVSAETRGSAPAIWNAREQQTTKQKRWTRGGEGGTPVFGRGEVGAEDKTLPATAILLPSARALPNRLPLIRALRPLRHLAPSPVAMELDEERTVELTAEIGDIDHDAVFPVLRPRLERRYGAHIVMEDDPAIELWTAPAREFAQLLRDSGAFRLVRTWRLRLDESTVGNSAKARLETPAGGLFSASMLGHAGELIFFVSPCRSLHWVDGTFARLLEGWSGASIVLLHLRPRDRWAQTPLGEPQGTVSTLQAGSANRLLDVEPFWWRSGPDPAQPHVVTLPAITLEASALGQWARMQMGLGQRIEAFLLDATSMITPEEATALVPEALDERRALNDLHETSERAHDLAILLANAPFTLPVARLVQEVAQNGSTDFSVLADLMLSGVVLPIEGQHVRARENIYYRITETSRPLLLRSLRGADAEMLAKSLEERISRHLGELVGRPESFQALIAHPDGLEQLPDWARPFAHFLTALQDRGAQRTPTHNWQEDLASLDAATIGSLARLADADIVLSPRIVNPALWPIVDNPRFIGLSEDGALHFLPEVANQLRAQLAASPYLGLNFLWVDDNPDNNAQIVAHLRDRGAHTIALALTTEEALADPALRTYNIILSDMSRYGDDDAGYKLLRNLREQSIATPVLFFAGYTIRSLSSRARAIAAGAFGATSNVEEALSLINQAARANTLRQDAPAEPRLELRDLDDIPAGSFCTAEEIYREVKNFRSVGEAPIIGSLLFFRTKKQQSWLVVTRAKFILILDDPKTRADRRLVQRVAELSASTPVSALVDDNGVATVGFGKIAPRWYYSRTIFAQPDELEEAVRSLLEKVREQTLLVSQDLSSLSPERRAAQVALGKIGVNCSDEVALDIVIQAARLAPRPGYPDAVSLSRLFCGAMTVGDSLAPDTGALFLAAFARVMQSPSERQAREDIFSNFRARSAGEAMTRLGKSGFSKNAREALKQAADAGPSGSGLRSEEIVKALLNPITRYRSSLLYRKISIGPVLQAVTLEAGMLGRSAVELHPAALPVFGGLAKTFSRETRKALGYHAIFPPSIPMSVGTIGVLENSVFRSTGHIAEIVGLGDIQRKQSSFADVKLQSDEGVTVEIDAHTLRVSFLRRNSFLLHLSGCYSSQVRDLPSFAEMLVARFQTGKWQKNWHVVTEVIGAGRSTILMSGAAGSVVELGLEEQEPGHRPTWTDALQIRSSYGLAFSLVATSGLTPLFKVARVRQPVRSEPRLEIVP